MESETQPGTRLSSLMQVQKENSPKTVPTRPAALRRGAEKEKKKERKARRGLEKGKRDREGRRRPKPGNTAGNAGVKFDAGSKGKLTKNRADETGRSPRQPKRTGKARTENERNSESEAETKPQAPQRTFAGLFKLPQHHSLRNQPPGLYKNSTTEVKVVE